MSMLKVAIAGATGFVGRNLIEALVQEENIEIHALTRRVRFNAKDEKTSIQWKKCDVFSPLELENSLTGCDIAIYLIHSMLPTARLNQGSFSDYDLCLADNFVHAAKKSGIKQIIYLSGLIPAGKLSKHLESRLEVEETLRSTSVPLTTLRASLIVGENGSSFQIMYKLVQRLPAMVCPAWTLTKTQPIDIKDVILLIRQTFLNQKDLNKKDLNKSYDIGGPDVINYKQMLQTTAEVLDKKRYFAGLPIFTPTLSKLWVRLITQSPKELIYPLISSLRFEMIVDEKRELALQEKTSFKDSLKRTLLKKSGLKLKGPNVPKVFQFNLNFKWLHSVRSIQRMPLIKDVSAKWIGDEYIAWLPKKFPVISVRNTNFQYSLYLFGFLKLLEFSYSKERSSNQRVLYYITGGLLQRANNELKSRLEFRVTPICTLCAIHDYQPTLPWFIYKYSQALIHLFVMHLFRRHLEKGLFINEITQRA